MSHLLIDRFAGVIVWALKYLLIARRMDARRYITRSSIQHAAVCILLILIAISHSVHVHAKPADKKLDELRTRGFELLYNLDYQAAQRQFKEILKLYPDHPAGPQFMAAAIWARTLNESRRLQASLYNSESFYANNEDVVDPAVINEFRNFSRQARSLAEARLRKDPKDVEALYFLGASEGLRAAFDMAVRRSFIAALKSGSRSVDAHRDVIKLDPQFHDAELTIGLYDYIVGGLPLPVKLLASIGGHRGSKKRGLETLERVAREGNWARDDAKALLIVLYKREKRFADALKLCQELAAKYQRNYLFKLEAADTLVSMAAIARQEKNATDAERLQSEAFTLFASLLKEKGATRLIDLIHFRYGEALMTAGEFERAAKDFSAAAKVPGTPQGFATMSYLRAGQALDLAGQRDEAIAQYKIVLSRPNVYDSQDEARKGIREPFKQKRSSGTSE